MSGDQHLADVIMERARRFGLAGATVLRGQNGFGRKHRTGDAGRFDLSETKPVVIELVDAEDRLRSFLEDLSDLKPSLITMERAGVIFRHPG